MRATLRVSRKPAGYPSFLNHLGDHILRRRLDLGLQQKQLAERLGLGATNVANWEKGVRCPETRRLPKLIEFLGYDPRPVPEDIGGQLAHKRTALGLSKEAAAEHLGVDEGTVRKWEKGEREPRGRYLAAVLRFLGRERPACLSLADRLRRYREDRGLRQEDMAALLGIHEATYQRWETGQREPKEDGWRRVEAVLE